MNENERMNINPLIAAGIESEEAERLQKNIREIAMRGGLITEEALINLVIAFECQCMDALEPLKELSEYRAAVPIPPVELKRMIKYEKNPLRKKQLEKELNKAYREIKKRRNKNVKKERLM